jgi:hypothetical protein
MAVKTVDRTFLQGQSIDLFRAAIRSQATRDPYERRLIAYLKKMGATSPDDFVEFARNNPVFCLQPTFFVREGRTLADVVIPPKPKKEHT